MASGIDCVGLCVRSVRVGQQVWLNECLDFTSEAILYRLKLSAIINLGKTSIVGLTPCCRSGRFGLPLPIVIGGNTICTVPEV